MRVIVPRMLAIECTGNAVAQIALVAAAVILAAAGTHLYARYAVRLGITATINFRSLHKAVVPRGGGIVFALVFTAMAAIAWLCGMLPPVLALVLCIGSPAAAIFGFFDDVVEVWPLVKIGAHTCLGLWGAVALVASPASTIVPREGFDPFVTSIALIAVFVWFINLYNFIDGIDGMAASGSVFICGAAMAVLITEGGAPELIFAFALLAACSAGFLAYNLPPARLFMGDAGSIFLGYTIAGLLLFSILSSRMSVWTWLAILSYYIGDTTVTGAYRLVCVRQWYRAHRSHAYQNLARIYDSHALVTYGVTLYNLLWALPMAFWTVHAPEYAPLAATLALAPVAAWTFRFGPRLSSS